MTKRKIDILTRFGAALRSARTKAGLTQEEVSDRAGIARSKLSDYERGRKNISLLMAEKLADALDTELSTMVRQGKR